MSNGSELSLDVSPTYGPLNYMSNSTFDLSIISYLFDRKSRKRRFLQSLPISSVGIRVLYFIKYKCALFYIENDAEIFLAHYTWKVAEKGFKMAFMM
jgi:hypothetical protein